MIEKIVITDNKKSKCQKIPVRLNHIYIHAPDKIEVELERKDVDGKVHIPFTPAFITLLVEKLDEIVREEIREQEFICERCGRKGKLRTMQSRKSLLICPHCYQETEEDRP